MPRRVSFRDAMVTLSNGPSLLAGADTQQDERCLEPLTVAVECLPSIVSAARSMSLKHIGPDKPEPSHIALASDFSQLSASLTQRAIFGRHAPQFFIRGVGSNHVYSSDMGALHFPQP